MGDRRACHPGNRRGAPRGRRPAILADIATALPQDKSSVPDAQRRAQTRLLSLVHGFTPWVYAGLFRPPGEDAADPVSPLGIAEILPALPLSFPLPSSAERVPPKRVSPKGCLGPIGADPGTANKQEPPGRGGPGGPFAERRPHQGGSEGRSSPWPPARVGSEPIGGFWRGGCDKAAPRHGAERDQKGRSTSSTCWP